MNYYYCLWETEKDNRHLVIEAPNTILAVRRFRDHFRKSTPNYANIGEGDYVEVRIVDILTWESRTLKEREEE